MTTLNLHAHPYYGELAPLVCHARPGQTLAQMMREAADGADLSDALHVTVRGAGDPTGHTIPLHMWNRVRPKHGAVITVVRMPERNSAVARTVLLIAVAVVAWWAAPYLTGAYGVLAGASTQLVAAGLTLVGNALVNAAIPPPSLAGPNEGTQGQWNSLTGTGNALSPGSPIPCVVGRARLYPTHAAIPYSQTVGDTSYHYYLFDLGYGAGLEADMDTARIGDTPLSSDDEVEGEITKTPSGYPQAVAELSVGAELVDGMAWVERTSAPDIDSWSLDILFPSGAWGTGTSGKDFKLEVYFDIEMRPVGGTWVELSEYRISGMGGTGNSAEPFLVHALNKRPFSVGISGDVTRGQYEFRVRRVRTHKGGSDNSSVGTAQWTVLRSVRAQAPSTTDTWKLAMRIKASDQLSGMLQTLSLEVSQGVMVYDDETDTWSRQHTTNTAWVAYWLLTECPAFAKHVPASRIDLDSFLDYADFCTVNDLNTMAVLDTRATAGEYLRDVLANSLARLSDGAMGRYAVLFDDGARVTSGMFTELEAGSVTWSRAFLRQPHALRVRFRNPDADWDWDEIIVLNDGYSYRGVDARGNPSAAPEPSLFESLELRHIADPFQAWKLGRLQLGQARYQAATVSFATDVAGLSFVRGDVVMLQADVVSWGDGAGWVRDVSGTTVRLDQKIETEAGTTYSAQVRRVDSNGAQVIGTYPVTPHSVITDTFYFESAPTVAVGDSIVIGASTRMAQPVMLTNRRTMQDHNFTFTGVPYTADVAAYWANPPEELVSEITGTVYNEAPDPPDVTVDPGDRQDDAGIVTPVIGVGGGGWNGPLLPHRTFAL